MVAGVCYGVVADNLPSASDVVQLYKSKGITGMRIYFPDSNALKALSGSGINLIIDTGNDQLGNLAASASNAAAWVKANIQAYQGLAIKYITVGNEVSGSDTQLILPAMKNVNSALSNTGLGGIKVSTAVQSGVTAGFPPSHGTFSDSGSHMPPIVQYLASTGAPLLANIYPYFSYKGDTTNIASTMPSSPRRTRWCTTTAAARTTRTCSTRSWTPCTPRSRAPGLGMSASWCPRAGGRRPVTRWRPRATRRRTTRT
uniref:Uncharacterized protein n=1 Tax=Avena sativa TaxID=4498 RepID=A0ACD5XFP4_AVESA